MLVGAEAAHVGRVVEQGEKRGGDLLAQPLGERRAALHDLVAGQHAGDDARAQRPPPAGSRTTRAAAAAAWWRPASGGLARRPRPPRYRDRGPGPGGPHRRRVRSASRRRRRAMGEMDTATTLAVERTSMPVVDAMAHLPQPSFQMVTRTLWIRGIGASGPGLDVESDVDSWPARGGPGRRARRPRPRSSIDRPSGCGQADPAGPPGRRWRCPGPWPASSSTASSSSSRRRRSPGGRRRIDPDADTLAQAGGQRLDLALVGPHGGRAWTGPRTPRAARRPSAMVDDAARPARPSSGAGHAAVPPTVSAGDPQGGLADADGHALAVLAAGAGTAHGEVVAHGVDVGEHLGPVADEVAVAQRVGDLAVLDEVRLGHAEHEVAGGRVDLAAAELRHVHAVRRLAR